MLYSRLKWLFLTGWFLLPAIHLTARAVPPAPVTHPAALLGNPDFPAICYGGYRHETRDRAPTVTQIEEDLRILHALGIRFLRTYNTQQYPHAARLLEAIDRLQAADPDFRMYVMLGTWIECRHAWTDQPDHSTGNAANNRAEIDAAVELANRYPDSVRVIAVGNEAMVTWATSYFVEPPVILKWVNHLRELRRSGGLPADTWITSSDNFASWGGGDASYRTPVLAALVRAVDYLSVHTYAFHDTHYNPAFWSMPEEQAALPAAEQSRLAIDRAVDYTRSQVEAVRTYLDGLGVDKPIHLGETGWASQSDGILGSSGSRAADELKQKLFHDGIRAWGDRKGMSVFYFEAFDEPWKDAANPQGSENHFGLFTVDGRAKHVLWDAVAAGTFDGLSRDGNRITPTYGGDLSALLEEVFLLHRPGGRPAHRPRLDPSPADRPP